MVIREFEEKYNELVNEFIVSIFIDEFGFENYRDILSNENNIEYKNDDGGLWIYFDDEDKIIGTVALKKSEDGQMILKKMYVDSNYRGTGIAQELFNIVIEFCKKNEIKEIMLSTFRELERAVKFYIKNGFQEMEELRRDDGARFFRLEIE